MLKNKPPIPLCFWAVISVKVFHTNFKALSWASPSQAPKVRQSGSTPSHAKQPYSITLFHSVVLLDSCQWKHCSKITIFFAHVAFMHRLLFFDKPVCCCQSFTNWNKKAPKGQFCAKIVQMSKVLVAFHV